MSAPNLHQFILSARNTSSKRVVSVVAWVKEPKFSGLYVRYGRRVIRSPEDAELRAYDNVLDISNVTVDPEFQRKGVFTRLIHQIREMYPDVGIYVENAQPDTLRLLLLRLGFKQVTFHDLFDIHSYFLPPIQEQLGA